MEKAMHMKCSGAMIGGISFLIIGIFHPVVIKCEYNFTEKVWPVFLAVGLLFCVASLRVKNIIGSAALAVTGFTLLWSIGERKEQTQRVKRGWFPANPKRSLHINAEAAKTSDEN